ncbi:MAG TPA: HAD family acid phosphatase, partial [Terracidiphilus sp.]|nr:HAD family acid phosphatase [Terracidiphilus sp.]
APVAPGESLPNLDKLKDRLRRYHDCTCSCGCYAKDLDAQATRAMAFLQRRAAHRQAHEKLALVLDIDETTLSNYAEMVRAGFAYDSKAFIDWEKLAAAPAIPGTLELYREAGKLGVAVFFLTGRSEPERATTEVDLRSQDFDHWQQLILRSPSQASATAQAYKSAERAAIRAQGYKIVLNVGDQWSDLRGEPEAEYSVKYPNPYYFIP